jgi:hypothetical protein
MLVIGVFVGSAAWWLMLSFGGAWLRTRLSTTWTSSVGRLNGLLLVALGGVALLQLPDPERAFCPRTFAVSLDQPPVPA